MTRALAIIAIWLLLDGIFLMLWSRMRAAHPHPRDDFFDASEPAHGTLV